MPGLVYQHGKKRKRLFLSDRISIASLEESFVINKNGGLSVDCKATLFEEEALALISSSAY